MRSGTCILTAPLWLALLAVACGGTSVTELAGPGGVRCQAVVSPAAHSVSSSGGSLSVTVSAARECSWSAESESPWLTVTPSSGQGSGTLVVSVSPNATAATRQGAVTISDSRLSVAQAAAACRVELSESGTRIGHEGSTTAVELSAAAGCAWEAVSSASWIRVRNGRGSGAGTVTLEAEPNNGGVRSGTVAIAGRSFTVTQEARPSDGPSPSPSPPPPPPPAPAPPPPAPCVFAIDPATASFDRSSANGSFRVQTSSGCAWSASSSAAWVTIVSDASGTGSGQVRYRVSANPLPAPRTATISVAGRTHLVTQEAGRAERVKVEGRVSNLSGSCPNLTFNVSRYTVVTDSRTVFDDGTCRDIRERTKVEVEGELLADGRVRAIEVELD